MNFLSTLRNSAPVECPYLTKRLFVQECFFATDVTEHELGLLLNAGWRHFGKFFFRPACLGCRRCVPIRIDASRLTPTSSQRRVLSRGRTIRVDIVSPSPTEEAWEVYRAHSKGQFNKEANRRDFENTFYAKAVPTLQSEYRFDGKLIGLGFLDTAEEGISSVYFSFDPQWARYSLGVLSVFREAKLVRELGKSWYYMGYWVSGCASMDYKAKYRPHQLFNWESGVWHDGELGASDEKVLQNDVG